MFREAFGSETISGPAIAQALATFERTIVSNRAPFDRWIDGDDTAIDEQARQGFALFNGKANCAACHSGWRFTDDSFHDIGLKSADIGRGAFLPDLPVMQHAFKTPTLRNIATREPFMHDGSAATLRDVLAHYDTGFTERPSLSPEMRRLGLTAQETEALLAFLRTLTSTDDPIPVPALPTKELPHEDQHPRCPATLSPIATGFGAQALAGTTISQKGKQFSQDAVTVKAGRQGHLRQRRHGGSQHHGQGSDRR